MEHSFLWVTIHHHCRGVLAHSDELKISFLRFASGSVSPVFILKGEMLVVRII
jgi:hypothetical protein